MEKNIRLIQLISFLMVLSSLGSAEGGSFSLDDYRQAMGSKENQQTKAVGRSSRLRTLLGTEKNQFNSAQDLNGPFRKYEAGTDAGSKESIAVLYKTFLEKEISALRDKERRDRPPTFDPSQTSTEQKDSIDAVRKKYCSDNMTPKFAQLANELSKMASRKAAGVEPNLAETAAKLNEERRKLIATYMNELKLTDAVGDLVEVTFVDRHVHNLWFLPKGKPAAFRAPYNLSSLINFRSQFDKYFIVIQGCFVSYLDGRMDGSIAGKESKELLDAIHPIAMDSYLGSKLVYSTYARLNRKQIDLLIDLFLQLRGDDIPTDEEMTPEPVKSWNFKKNPSVVTYIENQLAVNPHKNVEVLLADYRFYRLLHRQLYDLEDYLIEERTPVSKEVK